jgi:amino acid transporter
LFAYLLEYFAANFMLSSKLTSADGSLTGIAAAGSSSAPIGDMAIQLGNVFLGGNGFAFMLVIAATVAIAILGTTLAAMNTGVRISFAMAQDSEMPDVMGLLHEEYATPHYGVMLMIAVSAIIGVIGVLGGVMTLTAITLASNLGTFILYALICALTTVAFIGDASFSAIKHVVVPVLGLITNVIMVLTIFVLGIQAGGMTAQSTFISIGIAGAWLLVSVYYLLVTSRRSGRAILPKAHDMVSEER